jgi:NAD+ kinase
MRKINKVSIIYNNNPLTKEVKKKLEDLLFERKFEIVKEDPDLVIAIGGDGSFLRSTKKFNFNSDLIYVGVNTGSLGFLQEVKPEDLECFIDSLNNSEYKLENIKLQETEVLTDSGVYLYYSLNEILIREKDLNTVILDIKINGAKLEKYIGDGILIATSIGSTAYNLSFGGSIVQSDLHTLQITPIAPLNNKVYRNLLNSIIIPENNIIEVIPSNKKIMISIDGDIKKIGKILKITTYVKNKELIFLRLNNYNFYEKLNEKFLK